MATLLYSKGLLQIALLSILYFLSLSFLLAAQPAFASKIRPKHLEFYMYIAVQNNSNLHNPMRTFTAVQSAQPLSPQPNSFGIIHSFDNPLTSSARLNSTHLGRVQGWYGDVGQDLLTLFLVQTFTWDDGKYRGTFSLVGIDIANDPQKFAPIVGGTGDFAYARGIAKQSLFSTANVNFETVSWFHYIVDFKY